MGSVGIEDEDAAVFAGGFARGYARGYARPRGAEAEFEALVEKVEPRVSIVSGYPFADGLPRRLDGLEGLDVEGRVGRRRDDRRLGCGLWSARGFWLRR